MNYPMTVNYNFVYKTTRKRNKTFYVSARRYPANPADKPEFTTSLFWNEKDAREAAYMEANYREQGKTMRYIDGWPIIEDNPPMHECGSKANYVSDTITEDLPDGGGACDYELRYCLNCKTFFRN